MLTRRQWLMSAIAAVAGGGALLKPSKADAQHAHDKKPANIRGRHTQPEVLTPNGTTLPYKMKNGVKEFHLTAEPVLREFAPGMSVNCWGYNGQSPGPTIEAVEGDRVRILVTNRLPEHTTIH